MAKTSVDKELSISDLIQMGDKEPVYVVNTTTKRIPTGAEVYITVMVNNNQTAVVKIPITWIPVSLTDQAPRSSIVNSPNFLRAVNEQQLQIVSKEYAQEVLSTERASTEIRKLREYADRVQAAIRRPDDDFKLTLEGDEDTVDVSKSKSFFDEASVSASFQAWVSKNNLMNVEEAVSAIMTRRELSDDELSYFVENTKHDRVRAGLKRIIDRRSSKN